MTALAAQGIYLPAGQETALIVAALQNQLGPVQNNSWQQWIVPGALGGAALLLITIKSMR